MDVARQLGHSLAMKETYNNLDEKKIKARARKIWIKPEDLPPEKKEEYEKQIKYLRNLVEEDMMPKMKKMQEKLCVISL